MSLTKKDKEEIMELNREEIERGIEEVLSRYRQGEANSAGAEDDGFSIEAQAKRWAENGIKSELTGTTIAPEDLYIVLPDGTKKTHFTYEKAEELVKQLPDGWRLPTRSEWALIAEEFGNSPETGELSSERLRSKLNLGLNGWIDSDNGSQNYVGSYGYFWSSTRYNNYSMYRLGVDTSSVNPASGSNRSYGFSVRCLLKATS